MAGAAILVVALPAMSVLTETPAAASTPTLIQSAAGKGSNGTSGSTVNLTATLGSACTAGDTLIAMVTIAQQNSAGGMVSDTPPGWQRLFEHSPVDTSPYQGWFALSNCGGTQSATFLVTAPGDSAGTSGSVVLDEFSGLPNPVAEDFSVNDGSSSTLSSETLPGEAPAASGELTLTALSFYGGSPSSTTPSGWSAAGSEASTLPSFVYWKVGTSSTPSASFSWSPAASFEVTMLALKAGPSSAAPNVVQENQGGFAGQSSWSVNLPTGVSAGDALVALIGTDVSGSTGSGFEATAVSGGAVTWQRVTGFVQSGNGSAEVWIGFASTGSSGSTPVTATMASSLDGHMVVSEVSRVAAVDTSSTNHGTSATPTAGSITPTSGDFVVGLLTTNPTVVVTHPYPNWSTYSVPASSYAAEWLTNVPSGSSTPQWSTTPSGGWITVQAAFYDDASAPVVPTVTSVSPSSGSTVGGTSVTITGTDFIGVTAVDFGSSGAATSVTVISSTSITATVPAGSVGMVDVTVTASGTTSATNVGDQYSYVAVLAPVVTGVSPSFGSGKGGSTVTVTGANLLNASGVFFGSTPGVIQLDASGTSLVATTAPGTGTVDVTVTTPGGNSVKTAADRYTYQGYWMVGADGGVFAFGDAGFVGSLPGLGVRLSDIVAVVPTSTRKGYWMVGADGGVFAFGDAGFVGSLPSLKVHVNDVVGVVPSSTGKGYWMVGKDGGVFAFGDAGFVG